MLKGYIHNLISNYSNIKDQDDLYKKIEKYEYVSFDIFDTLIKRDVPKPTDIFDILGKKVKIDDFKKKRIKAELDARQGSNDSEINLDDIYSKLSYLPNVNAVKKLECEIEISECVQNKWLYDFYNYCVKNKKVILITDMYLPRGIIEEILKKNHLNGYHSLLISNEEKLIKSDGGLFLKALDKEGISGKDIIHIGNSMKADFLGAKKSGITAIKVPTFKNRINRRFNYNFLNNYNYNYLMTFINNHIDNSSEYYDFGYQSFGPLLYGFVEWLRRELKGNGFEQVLFLARDGYIIKEIYDYTCNESNDIPSDYFEASRRSLRVPTYNKNMNYEDMLRVLTVPNLTNPEQVLDSWGLNPNMYINKLSDFGFSLTENIKRDDLIEDDKFRKFFDEVKNDIFNNSKNELKNLKLYLKKFDFNKKTAIVDIGWGGSMQYFLTKTLDKMNINNKIFGYYIGLTEKSLGNLKQNGLKAKGYAFDAMNKGDQDRERPFVGLFETLFLEQAGSVKKYKFNENDVEVKRYPYEYINNGIKGREIECVRLIQAGAINFNKDFHDTITAQFIGFNNEVMFNNLYDVGIAPSMEDVNLFGKFEFFNNGTKVFLANPKSVFYYFFHISDLKNDLYNSQWKTGFLKGILKLHFNYKLIFNILRKATN